MAIITSVCCLSNRYVTYRRVGERTVIIYDIQQGESRAFTIEGLGDSLGISSVTVSGNAESAQPVLVYGRYCSNPEVVIIENGVSRRCKGVANCAHGAFVGSEAIYYSLYEKGGKTSFFGRDEEIVNISDCHYCERMHESGTNLLYKKDDGYFNVEINKLKVSMRNIRWLEKRVLIEADKVKHVVGGTNGKFEFLMKDNHIINDSGQHLALLQLDGARDIGVIERISSSAGYLGVTFDSKSLANVRLVRFDITGTIIAESVILLDKSPASEDIGVYISHEEDHQGYYTYMTSFGLFILRLNCDNLDIEVVKKITLE